MGQPLYVYSGGFLTQARVRRILELSGWDVRVGLPAAEGDCVGVWGNTPSAPRGEAIARMTDTPVVRIEDAFLRSVRPGRTGGGAPVGLTIDRRGVHYDATRPSDIEHLLATEPLDDTAILNRARDAIDAIKRAHLGKYSATDPDIEPPAPGYVVVIDQTEGDAALQGAGRVQFLEMLQIAREENPATRIIIKTHPETASGARGGHFRDEDAGDEASILSEPISPWRLLDGATAVYTHSSTLGFEAIFAGHRPRVFGTPFYAGWGRTDDSEVFSRRGRDLTRAQLFAGAMLHYPAWYDPVADRLCDVEDVIHMLAARARAFREDGRGWVGAGMRRWKRPAFRRNFPGIRFAPTAEKALRKAERMDRRALVWGTSGEDLTGVVRVEDGFLRSRGLGADLIPAVSLTLDDLGLSFDPARESRLERLIRESADLPLAELRRAERLVARITRADLTKYNIEGAGLPQIPEGHRILVAGQVDDDASVRLGTRRWKTNVDLLREARERNPDAVILWKPHPDVEAGLRKGTVTDWADHADIKLSDVTATDALAIADEVWTLTSGLGFEALLRGIPVTTLGLPFYAGWGLTTDLDEPPSRREPGPSLAGLAHAALIGYPRYFDPDDGTPLSPEQALVVLGRPPRPRSRLARLQRLVRKAGF